MNALDIQIKEAKEKAEEWIVFLATYSDKRLEKKLRINRTQQVHASEQENEKAFELLRIMEEIIILARIYKEENEVTDTLDELKENVKDVESYVSLEKNRQKVFSNDASNKSTRKIIIENNEDQLSLFD